MKVNDVKIPALAEIKKPEKKEKKDSSSSVAGVKDTVAISPKAAEMQAAIEAAKAAPDIRKEKVQLLKDEIDRGMYRVRGSNVAEKIIDSALEKQWSQNNGTSG